MKKGLKIFGLITVGILVLSVFSYLFADEETKKEMAAEEAAAEAQKEKEAEEKKQEKTRELTIEEKVEKAIVKAVKDKTNMDKKRIVSIAVENDVATIELNGSENITTNMTRDTLLNDSRKVFEQLDKVEGLNGYHLSWYMTMVDVKGNKSDSDVLRIALDKEHGIQWENFNFENFDKVANSFYLHPAFQE